MIKQAGTLKGHVFDPADADTMPSFIVNSRTMSAEQKREWAEAETKRYAIVGTCDRCDPPRDLIEGEQIPHRMSHASPKAASAAMTVLQRGPDVAAEAFALLREVLEG